MLNNLVVVADLHCGCRVGLCPRGPVPLDGGGTYSPSRLQQQVYSWWEEFWGLGNAKDGWVQNACHNEPFAVVVNGDALDGVHHGSKTQVSQNHADQTSIALSLLKPIRDLCNGQLYMVRGTEAHVGQSGEMEEMLARELGAIPDEETGHYSRFLVRYRLGGKGLVHCTHHIGTTGRSHYETSAVWGEYMELCAVCGQNGLEAPQVSCRSHRHRHIEARNQSARGYGISFVTAGWQLMTPFAYKIPGGRVTTPQIGGSIIRQGDQDIYTRHKVWHITPPKEVVL